MGAPPVGIYDRGLSPPLPSLRATFCQGPRTKKKRACAHMSIQAVNESKVHKHCTFWRRYIAVLRLFFLSLAQNGRMQAVERYRGEAVVIIRDSRYSGIIIRVLYDVIIGYKLPKSVCPHRGNVPSIRVSCLVYFHSPTSISLGRWGEGPSP